MSSAPPADAPGHACLACGTQLAPRLLECPACQRLVHAARLGDLARDAERLEAEGDIPAALTAWREAQALLPRDARQHAVISGRIDRLSRLPAQAGTKPRPAWGRAGRVATAGGALALLAWKLKAVLILVATKGKLLLLGLTKSSTLLSMLLSLGVYWAAFGWPFALGLIVSLYIHEMGHVAELRRLGYPASAPMFIPGLGAYVRLGVAPNSPAEDARIGLAGPTWGLAAAACTWLLSLALGSGTLAAIARIGAWINLFNLVPVWQLDGARGFAALTRPQRALGAAAAGAAFLFTHDGMLLIVLGVGVARTVFGPWPEQGERSALVRYVTLVLLLSLLLLIPVPLPVGP